MKEVTGERLLPEEQHGELVHAEHLARYRVAAGLAKGRRVLDAACGEGYGSALLAAAGATSVTGVDIDEPTVHRARERYGLNFEVADVGSLPFDAGEFGLVVCFETIEHVQDPKAMLAELSRVLDPAGLLVISTPNKHEYLVENDFHTREFFHEEFVDLLGGLFPSVRPLYQHNWTTSAVLEETDLRECGGNRSLDVRLYKVAERRPGRELYTLAICGEEADTLSVPEIAVASSTDEAHALARRAVDAEGVALQRQHELEQAREAAALWHSEYERAKQAAERWHDDYQTIARSHAWRLTAPLRRLSSLLKRRYGR